MTNRLDLQMTLEEILGSKQVYFQPPETVKMKYPAIVYSRSVYHVKHADDTSYIGRKRYSILLITKDPDSPFEEKLLELPFCSFKRYYKMDNLNHYSFEIYY